MPIRYHNLTLTKETSDHILFSYDHDACPIGNIMKLNDTWRVSVPGVVTFHVAGLRNALRTLKEILIFR